MPLSSEHLRRLADELDAEEAAQRQELADAETAGERSEIRERLERLEARNQELEAQLAERGTPEPEPEPAEPEPDEDETAEAKPKMRRGRKHGQVYQDRPGEAGYVFQGSDEPDLVPVGDEAAA